MPALPGAHQSRSVLGFCAKAGQRVLAPAAAEDPGYSSVAPLAGFRGPFLGAARGGARRAALAQERVAGAAGIGHLRRQQPARPRDGQIRQPSMKAGEWASLVLLASVWGGSFFFNAVAVRDLPVLSIVTARVILAAVLLRRHAPGSPASGCRASGGSGGLLAMGMLNNALPFALIVGARPGSLRASPR